jgi:hypothetical protein
MLLNAGGKLFWRTGARGERRASERTAAASAVKKLLHRDPDDSAWADDPGMKGWRGFMTKCKTWDRFGELQTGN